MKEHPKGDRRFLKKVTLCLIGAIIFYSVISFDETSYSADNTVQRKAVNETIIVSDSLAVLDACFSFSERNCFVSKDFDNAEKISIYVQIVSIRMVNSEFFSKVTDILQSKFINIPPPSIS